MRARLALERLLAGRRACAQLAAELVVLTVVAGDRATDASVAAAWKVREEEYRADYDRHTAAAWAIEAALAAGGMA